MNSISLALKSLRFKPLATSLNVILMAVGITMMTFVLSASKQLEDNAQRDAQGRHLQLFSSVSLTLARSSDGSFSIARSSIWTAFSLSPCFAEISPR